MTTKLRHAHFFGLLVLLCVLQIFITPSVFGQSNEAEIFGSVTDSSGAAIPKAQVTLTNVDTGVTHTTTVQADGQYRFSPVAPGNYRITVKADNFQTATVTNLAINLGASITQNITMKVGSSQQTVEVTGEVPVIDTSSNDVSGLIDQEQITTLPINTRQYLNLALLEPGTSQDATRTFYNNVQVAGGGYFYANGTQQYVPGTSRNQGNRDLNLAAVNAYRATQGLTPVTASMMNTNPYDSFDVHFSRKFSLPEHRYIEVIAQVFNLFGHQNLQGVAAGTSGYLTNAASPTGFGTLGSAGNLQQAELAARFVF